MSRATCSIHILRFYALLLKIYIYYYNEGLYCWTQRLDWTDVY